MIIYSRFAMVVIVMGGALLLAPSLGIAAPAKPLSDTAVVPPPSADVEGAAPLRSGCRTHDDCAAGFSGQDTNPCTPNICTVKDGVGTCGNGRVDTETLCPPPAGGGCTIDEHCTSLSDAHRAINMALGQACWEPRCVPNIDPRVPGTCSERETHYTGCDPSPAAPPECTTNADCAGLDVDHDRCTRSICKESHRCSSEEIPDTSIEGCSSVVPPPATSPLCATDADCTLTAEHIAQGCWRADCEDGFCGESLIPGCTPTTPTPTPSPILPVETPVESTMITAACTPVDASNVVDGKYLAITEKGDQMGFTVECSPGDMSGVSQIKLIQTGGMEVGLGDVPGGGGIVTSPKELVTKTVTSGVTGLAQVVTVPRPTSMFGYFKPDMTFACESVDLPGNVVKSMTITCESALQTQGAGCSCRLGGEADARDSLLSVIAGGIVLLSLVLFRRRAVRQVIKAKK